MPWLLTRFTPGFSLDLTSWTTEIELNGRLTQSVQICRFDPHEQRTENYRELLSPKQVAELKQLIAAIDFDALGEVDRYAPDVTDVPMAGLIVEGEPTKSFGMSLHYYCYLQVHDENFDHPVVLDALKLWKTIERFSPWRIDRD